MARLTFGGTGGDFVVSSTGAPMPGDTGTVWTARTGGSQVTDLRDVSGNALATSGVIVAGSYGEVIFQGPDDGGATTALWVDFGGGVRVLVKPTTATGGGGGSGTVTSVTAGNGTITVAGTATDPTIAATIGTASGTVAAGDHNHSGAVMASLVTAKGDLIAATGSGAVDNLAVGTNDYVLTADSTTATGLKWAAAAGGSGIAATIFDAKGDLIAASAADTAAKVSVGADGHVLVASSAASAGVAWQMRPMALPPPVNNYFQSNLLSGLTRADATFQSVMLFTPVWIPVAMTVDRIGVLVTTGAASAVVRLGIYTASASTLLPDSLLVDAGTVDASTTGFKEATISQSLSVGLYYMAGVPQTAAPSLRFHSAGGLYGLSVISAATGAEATEFANSQSIRQTSVTGDLPSTTTLTYGRGNSYVPLALAMRRSA